MVAGPDGVEALQLQEGVVSVVGVVATDGVPGVVGSVVSIVVELLVAQLEVLPARSRPLTLKYQVPSAKELVLV